VLLSLLGKLSVGCIIQIFEDLFPFLVKGAEAMDVD
jgi:hypothetical protein